MDFTKIITATCFLKNWRVCAPVGRQDSRHQRRHYQTGRLGFARFMVEKSIVLKEGIKTVHAENFNEVPFPL